MAWIDLLRCRGAIAVGCRPVDGFIKVGILGVEASAEGAAAVLVDTASSGDRYPVQLPAAGVYYRVLLERLFDAPTD